MFLSEETKSRGSVEYTVSSRTPGLIACAIDEGSSMKRSCVGLCLIVAVAFVTGSAREPSFPYEYVPATGGLLPCYVGEELHPVPLEGEHIYLGPCNPHQPVREIQIPIADRYWEHHGWSIAEACAHFDDMDAASISEWVQTHYSEVLVVNGQELLPSYISIARLVDPEEDNTVYWAIRYAYQFPEGFIAPGVYVLALEHLWTMSELICTPSEWVPEVIVLPAVGPQTTTVTISYEPAGT
jgi:hypothetical protein